ncbi:metal-dependent hydrolase [Natranaeroarchaeum aerophilus]|uniref:Metal-dependent hydrolase n=1 Tax=Natranaeroarchaeum aerophilus TaxID=2917711 RepID=A0AAE3FTX6_9EURY|nr:metal-dependent hydrolase [Natranaeroarchaeum aerophilus]MCL9815055.1 metal-dependent hydrolase [Natranaeroarchaeum aerophilus]
MWPWEHAAVGYLAYSLFCHTYYRESPGGLDAFAVLFASVLPDLIDKPLAYQFGVFETGYALGHSIFFAVPFAIFTGVLARQLGYSRAGLAFAIGYLLHLPGDFVPHYFRGTERFHVVLWPIADQPDAGHSHGLYDFTMGYFVDYWAALTTGDPPTYLLIQTGVVAFTLLLWLYDGAPVLRECLAAVGDTIESLSR